MSVPFDHAEAYRAAGWSGTLAFEPRKKFPPPTGFTGHDGGWPSPADLTRWRSERRANIGLRLQHGVIGLDVDAYDGKPGRESLAKLEAAHGPLPATWMSTSRVDGVSGIRLFRVPHAVRDWPTDAEDAIEIIRYAHRYAMVSPSVHPEGRVYRWVRPDGSDAAEGEIPSPGDLAELPAAWLNALTGEPSANGSRRPKGTRVRSREADAKAREWLRSLPKGEPCRYVGRLIAEDREVIRDATRSRYDSTRDIVGELLRAGEVGHPGVRRALVDLRGEYKSAVAEKRGGQAIAEGEFDRFTLNGAAKILADPSERAGSGCDCFPSSSDGQGSAAAGEAAAASEAGARDFTHDGLALELGDCWQDARYVSAWGQWLFYTGAYWRTDESLLHMTRCRAFLRTKAEGLEALADQVEESGAEDDQDELMAGKAVLDPEKLRKLAKSLRDAKTVAQVVNLARSNLSQAAVVEQWDRHSLRIGTPTRKRTT